MMAGSSEGLCAMEKKSSSHLWLKRWRGGGTFEYLDGRIQVIATDKLKLRRG
ncbi:MAG: hypothetical protein JHC73_11420 [Dolichospermum sp.]|nr:hypothetical protein [Dolichospermum sp.]